MLSERVDVRYSTRERATEAVSMWMVHGSASRSGGVGGVVLGSTRAARLSVPSGSTTPRMWARSMWTRSICTVWLSSASGDSSTST